MNSKLLLVPVIAAGLFMSCETEIDITAPYERIPVIFGLLDQGADTQYIMINRTFLGTGNAFDMAENEDSMLYDNVNAKIVWGNGASDSVGLRTTNISDKDLDGAFFAPNQLVYYWASSGHDWDYNRDYELQIEADGDQIYSKTLIVNPLGNFGTGIITKPSVNGAVNFVNSFNPDGSIYSPQFQLEFRQAVNGVKHQSFIRFHYVEHMNDGSEVPKSIDIRFGNFEAQNVDGDETFSTNRSGDFFYRAIETQILDDPNVMYRAIGELDFNVYVSGEDFTTYLNVSDPVSDVGQERPTFSNINDGEGIGIFSSRGSYTRTKPLYTQGNEDDLEEMANGQFTRHLCFCYPTGVSIDFGCDNPVNHCQ